MWRTPRFGSCPVHPLLHWKYVTPSALHPYLIAESTGKDGRGILPVEGEGLGPPDVYGDDRLFVSTTTGEHPPELDALEAAGHPVIRTSLEDLTGIA